MAAALEVKDLSTSFRTDDGIVQAVTGVSFELDKGKTLGVVGESGSGKSVTFLTVMGLVDPRQATVSGSVLLQGEEMLGASQSRMRQIRGRTIGMIFQDPMTSLNPVKTIGWQLQEAVLIHQDVSKKEARTSGDRHSRRKSRSRAPTSASTTTRISSRAACASA